MGCYFADAGPEDGIMMYCDVNGTIEVFEDPACSTPAGTARCVGWDAAGSAVWRLTVPDGDDDGPWVVVEREFISTRPHYHQLHRADAQHHLGNGRSLGRIRSRRPSQRSTTAELALPLAN